MRHFNGDLASVVHDAPRYHIQYQYRIWSAKNGHSALSFQASAVVSLFRTIVSLDGSGVEIPIAMTQKASNVTIDVTSVGAAYVGVLNAAGTELAGTWTQGSAVLPLTFRLATP